MKHTISITWDVTPRGLVYRHHGFKATCNLFIQCNLTRNTEAQRASVTVPTLGYMSRYRVPYRREQKSSIILLRESHTCNSNRCALNHRCGGECAVVSNSRSICSVIPNSDTANGGLFINIHISPHSARLSLPFRTYVGLLNDGTAQLHYSDVSTHAFISLCTITKLHLVDQSAPWCKIYYQKVTVLQINKKVSTLYAILRLVFVFVRPATGSYPQLFQLTPRLHEIFLENTFYVILPSMPKTSGLLTSVSPSKICIRSPSQASYISLR
jgi:hypothetical protein